MAGKKKGRESEETGSQVAKYEKNSQCIPNLIPVYFKGINLSNERGILKKPKDLFGHIKVVMGRAIWAIFFQNWSLARNKIKISKKHSVCLRELNKFNCIT